MKKVLCVGSLIIDIINSKIDKLPAESECIEADVTLGPGGNAYSMSVNLSRLAAGDVSVYCYGHTGKDVLGDLFENCLKQEGVNSLVDRVYGKGTSCNMILQEKDRDRRYIFYEGANRASSNDGLPGVLAELNPDIVVFGELPSIDLTGKKFLETVHYIRENLNSIIFLDLLINSSETYEWLSDDWKNINIIHCNYHEGLHITKASSMRKMCLWFLNKGVSLAVISDGKNGCYYGLDDKVFHIPAFNVEEVDATGAGDAMTAGIITKLLEIPHNYKFGLSGVDPDYAMEMIVFGSACGAIAVGNPGCIGNISRERVESLVKKRTLNSPEVKHEHENSGDDTIE